MAETLFDKIWRAHQVADLGDGISLILIDRVLLHERTGAIALRNLQQAGRALAAPEHVFCIVDHIVDTLPGRTDATLVPGGDKFIAALREAANASGITLFDVNDPRQGITHVVSPEQGIALPGLTIICPDSHTCTQGALGALAWGIGSSEAEHAMATGTLRVERPKSMRVMLQGSPSSGVTAKDMILALIAEFSAMGARGYAVEFAGEAVSGLDMEARMTLCNMAVEFGAFTGLIAPDHKTLDYVKGRPYAPAGNAFDLAAKAWDGLRSDEGANFDQEITLEARTLAPMVTWGTSPQHAMAVDGRVPDPASEGDADIRSAMVRALEYMDIEPGAALTDLPIGGAFIGSCTNSRIGDLRRAAEVLRGRTVAQGVRAICVPGSTMVKQQAESEGLDKIFSDAGFEWRESGCSMCFFAGGESFGHRERVVTSTNRNFESRQGPETRSHLASPETVAASAIEGRIADVRKYLPAEVLR